MIKTSLSVSATAAILFGLEATLTTTGVKASIFSAKPVNAENFVIVAAPIGSSVRSKLNIYEQISQERKCYSIQNGTPAIVNPLLNSFDFTGICRWYIDGNGFSLRIGDKDLVSYKLSIRKNDQDVNLVAYPTSGRNEDEQYLIARAGGKSDGFLELKLEPGWELRRRHYNEKELGHIYLYKRTNDELAASNPNPYKKELVQPLLQPKPPYHLENINPIVKSDRFDESSSEKEPQISDNSQPRIRFSCNTNLDVPTTEVVNGTNSSPFIRWTSDRFVSAGWDANVVASRSAKGFKIFTTKGV